MLPFDAVVNCPTIPNATYRIQFNSRFKLREATKLIPYLKDLGVSHVYSSPLLKARSGSTHCYDVVSHNEINPEIATRVEFEKFTNTLRTIGMGLLLDIVPNHMSTDSENKLWNDVLQKGVRSTYSDFFDIDWSVCKAGKPSVILPILGSRLKQVLKSGELRLVSDLEQSRPVCLELYGRKLPISIESYEFVLEQLMEIDNSRGDVIKKLLRWLNQESLRVDKFRNNMNISTLQKISTILFSMQSRSVLQRTLDRINTKVKTTPDWPEFIDFLNAQHYSLEYWREATKKLNYRRFFYINDLVALRTEDRSIFDEVHSLIFNLLEAGKVQALRVDHVDGLKDPKEYIDRLRRRLAELATHSKRIHISNEPYVVVEKILMSGENLQANWKISGTTGYDFLRRVNGLFVSKENAGKFQKIYQGFTGRKENFERVAYESRMTIAKRFMRPDVERLTRLAYDYKLPKSLQQVTRTDFSHAIEETVSYFPVYRTYASSKRVMATKDRMIIQYALNMAGKTSGPRTGRALRLLSYLLLSANAKRKVKFAEFCLKFQQLTPTIAAKGMEDTAFYRYFPLSSINDVGGDPAEFGTTIQRFHDENIETCENWPHTLLTSSTHDTKWSEDSRARLNVLSELPYEWRRTIGKCSKINSPFKTRIGRKLFPSKNDEYLLYESVMAALSIRDSSSPEREFASRIIGFMRKAANEEKRETDWVDPNPQYDRALQEFTWKVLDRQNRKFLKEIKPLLERVEMYGMYNSLSQLLLKLTCPGVPDIYQGCETWNLAMVDPDNRLPVNFDSNRRLLNEISQTRQTSTIDFAKSLLENCHSGMIKLHLLTSVLRFRNKNQDLFNYGNYVPFKASGRYSENVIVFAREHSKSKIIVATPRFFSKLCDVTKKPVGKIWDRTTVQLPAKFHGSYSNIFTGESVILDEQNNGCHLECDVAFGELPFCLLAK